MKKSIISGIIAFAAIILITTAASGQKIGSYTCKWHSGVSAADEEGLVNRMQFEEKSQFLFLVSNDEKNLYIDLIMADKTGIQKIMKFGLTTWLNPEGKHKKAMGIRFPVASEDEMDQPMMRGKGGDRKEMMQAMMAGKNEEMVLTGFGAKGEQKVIDPGIDSSFHGKVEMLEGGKLWVSLVLPVDKIGRSTVETLKIPFSVGFETGYLDLTRQGGMPAGGGQEHGGGGQMHGGGMPGGGMPGGGPPSGGGSGSQGAGTNQQQQQQPDISELAKPSKLWISQVTLAEKP